VLKSKLSVIVGSVFGGSDPGLCSTEYRYASISAKDNSGISKWRGFNRVSAKKMLELTVAWPFMNIDHGKFEEVRRQRHGLPHRQYHDGAAREVLRVGTSGDAWDVSCDDSEGEEGATMTGACSTGPVWAW
jgi:hypothetical protein